MSPSEWFELLDEPERIQRLFSTPPRLADCRLNHVHIDERGTSVTLGFETGRLPDKPLPDGWDSDCNTYEFFLTCRVITDLRVSGWGGGARMTVTVHATEDGRIAVSASGGESGTTFVADGISLTRSRVYLASAGH
jgi:hypothetical protein